VKLGPERRVYTFGAVLCVALTICSRHFADRGGPHFMAALTVAGITYLLAIREFFAMPKFPKRAVIFGLIIAAAWHVAFLRLTPGPDDDVHRYVWDGRLQRLGYNPYVVVPSDPAVTSLHTTETRSLNNPDLTSPYPPGAQLFFRAVTAIDESTFAMKVAFVVCDFTIVLVLLDLLRARGKSAHLVLAYAWNPLLAIEVAGSGHIDIVGALLLATSVAALAHKWRTAAAVTFGLAIAVKFLPIVLLPLYWKRIRIRDAALAIVIVALMYVPFLDHGHIPIGSLRTYLHAFRFNGPLFAALNHVLSPPLLASLAVIAGLTTAIYLGRTSEELFPGTFAWSMAASLLCAPVVFPWYLLWLLPFLTSPSTLLIIYWTVSIIPVYVMWHLRTISGTWGMLPSWVMLLEYGSLAIAALIISLRRGTRSDRETPAERSRVACTSSDTN
jgi:alpha-1,6-mannosyltransferase